MFPWSFSTYFENKNHIYILNRSPTCFIFITGNAETKNALGLALYHNYFFTHFVIKHGADANKKNHDGKTPLDLVKEGFPDVADLLRGDVALLEAAKKGTLAKVKV